MVELGIDIGGTSVKAAVRVDGRIVATGQSEPYVRPSAERLRAAIVDAVGPVERVDRVGLCVPGVLDVHRRVITLAVNVPGLVEWPLDEVVTDALQLTGGDRPTVVSNDAVAAAHGVWRDRRLRGRLLVLTLGTGVGNAVLDDGVPLLLGGGAGGHFGQLDVTLPGHEDVVGPDGGGGGLEGYVGVAALRRDYGPDVSATVAAFDGSEPPVRAVARAVRIAHAIFRPDHVCLCGGIGVRFAHLLPALRRHVDDRLTNLARPGWTLTCGGDDFDAARGAAQLAATAPVAAPARSGAALASGV